MCDELCRIVCDQGADAEVAGAFYPSGVIDGPDGYGHLCVGRPRDQFAGDEGIVDRYLGGPEIPGNR